MHNTMYRLLLFGVLIGFFIVALIIAYSTPGGSNHENTRGGQQPVDVDALVVLDGWIEAIPAIESTNREMSDEYLIDTDRKLLPDVPLDAVVQGEIYCVCDHDPNMFCAVMAIARTKTNFDTSAMGGGGKIQGMCQVYTLFHLDRIRRLGVTDLLDPAQCAMVTVDYLREIESGYIEAGVPLQRGIGSSVIYMAYDEGFAGALESIKHGDYSTNYSRATAMQYEQYRKELR